MPQVNIYDAKTNFSKLIERVEAGEEVIIARGGRQVARLTALASDRPKIRFGVLKGAIHIPDDFDEPLPDDVVDGFAGQ